MRGSWAARVTFRPEHRLRLLHGPGTAVDKEASLAAEAHDEQPDRGVVVVVGRLAERGAP